MPFLYIPALNNTREHPDLGVPTFRGVTLSDASPGAEEYFRAAGVLKDTFTPAQATSAVVAEIKVLAGEVSASVANADPQVAEATRLVEEAGKLASLPVLGTERATIQGFAAIVAASLESIAIPNDVTGPITFLKSVKPLIYGLDIEAIENALVAFDRELAGHEARVAKLREAHAKLLVLAAQADDGVNRDKVAKLKASIDFKRRLPQVIDELAAGRDQVAAVLVGIDRALGALRECA